MVTDEKGLTTTLAALPATFEELSNMAKAFVASGMFQDTKQLAQATVKIQAGRELGLPPVYSMQNINLIRGRLTTSANTMAMLVKKSGRYNYRIKEHHDKSCTIVFYERDGEKWAEVGESNFTIEDAKRADLVKPDSGWMKFPRAMLFSRAISQGARLYCPDAIGGVYTDEEIRAIPPALDVDRGKPEPIQKAPTSTLDDATSEGIELESSGNPQDEAVEPAPQIDSVELTWLKETLEIIKWTPSTTVNWINAQFGAPDAGKSKSLTQRVNSLTPEQLKVFVTHISSMRESAGQ